MSGESLFAIASEMLQHTNVFPKDVSELSYSSPWREDNISLLGCVEAETKKHNHRFRGKSERNLLTAYGCIAAAMVVYLESYPAVFSFKQQTKELFRNWLLRIRQMYSIADTADPAELTVGKNERDTGVAMLKLLHTRSGVTYGEIEHGIGGSISRRAIQKDFLKIFPSLYTGEGTPDVPFRLGGQPLLADIELVDPTETRAEHKRFRTLNSVHPLVLQENIMQLATLLKALAHQYYDQEDDVSRLIAVDIWSQMSSYARGKIIDYYAFDDVTLQDLISEINDPSPDGHACVYHTEKELLQEIEMPVDQALPYLMKVSGRTGTIKLISGERITVQQIFPMTLRDGSNAYRVTDPEGNTTILTRNQIEDVIVHK